MDAFRTRLTFDSDAMAADVRTFAADAWIPHFVEQNFEGDWSVIPLRGPEGETHPIRMIYSDPSCRNFVDTPFLDRAPSLRHAIASFETELHAVRLMKLGAGSRILPHRDHDLELAMGMARLHVPITTNPEVEFQLAGKIVAMRPGECWYLRLAEEHSARNDGAVDRVHLVIDAVVNDWVRDLVNSPGPS